MPFTCSLLHISSVEEKSVEGRRENEHAISESSGVCRLECTCTQGAKKQVDQVDFYTQKAKIRVEGQGEVPYCQHIPSTWSGERQSSCLC